MKTLASSVINETLQTQFLRALYVVPLAILMTISLLILMERLIHMANVPLDTTPPVTIPEVYWEEPVIDTYTKTEMPAKPAELGETPEVPKTDPGNEIGNIKVNVPKSKFDPGNGGKVNIAMNAGMPIAHFLGAARYPARALRNETEGFVDVIFDVNEFGGTENIRVLFAQPEGVFERAAIEAVERWRYKPKMEDNKPVRFEGMKNRIRFEMEKS